MKTKKIYHKLIKQKLLLFGAVLLLSISSIGIVILNSSPAFANCTDAKVSMSDDCVQKNCDVTGLSSAECRRVINDCANRTASVNIFTSFAGFTATQIGNCSNAMKSCFENLINTSACTNNGVLAFAASCNNGNVDASGEGDCGLDNAIYLDESASGQDNFVSNKDVQGQRKDALLKGCEQEGWTIQQIETCQNNIQSNFDECYSENGGTAKKFTDTSYTDCIAAKADNSGDCIASGGTWDGQQCSPPTVEENADGSTNTANQQAEDTLGNLGDKPQSKCTVKTESNPGGKEIKTNIINCTETSPDQIFGEILRTGIQALSVLVGIAAVGGIAWASVKYAKAEDNDGDVREAKDLIRNVITGLLFYVLMIAIVNWLVPGGVIG